VSAPFQPGGAPSSWWAGARCPLPPSGASWFGWALGGNHSRATGKHAGSNLGIFRARVSVISHSRGPREARRGYALRQTHAHALHALTALLAVLVATVAYTTDRKGPAPRRACASSHQRGWSRASGSQRAGGGATHWALAALSAPPGSVLGLCYEHGQSEGALRPSPGGHP